MIMSKSCLIDTLALIRETGIVPVFYSPDVELTRQLMKACYDGGIRAFEFTNRGEDALRVFEELVPFVRKNCPGMVLGAGTLLDAPTAAMYLQAGADFLVSPCMIEEVAALANRCGVPYCPGCGTVTEVVHAMEKGCLLVKLFPAGTIGGPAFVKNLLAPLPWAMLMATGSVEPVEENLQAWARAGVTAVGMGSKLFPEAVLKARDWESVTALCKQSMAWFQSAKA